MQIQWGLLPPCFLYGFRGVSIGVDLLSCPKATTLATSICGALLAHRTCESKALLPVAADRHDCWNVRHAVSGAFLARVAGSERTASGPNCKYLSFARETWSPA
jgi:hypothetical protein